MYRRRSLLLRSLPPTRLVPGTSAGASYDLTSDNCVFTAVNNAALLFPANATLRPATGHGWVFGLWFHVPHFFSQGNQVEVVANKGTTILGTGGSDCALYIPQDGTTSPLQILCVVKQGGNQLYPIANQPAGQAITRGTSYLFLVGQTGTTPFISLVDTNGNIISNTTGPATSIIGAVTTFTGLGCAAGSAVPQRGFEGRIGPVFFLNGAIPNSAGLPDPATIQALATGVLTPLALINSGLMSDSPSYRYFALLSVSDLTADQAGAITGSMTTQGTSVTPVDGSAVRTQTWLKLTQLGDGYVWGIKAGETFGTVRFDGVYNTGGYRPVIEGRLIRADNGAVVAGCDWRQLAQSRISGGAFSGAMTGVPAGVGFRREVRFKNRPSSAFAGKERHGVGIVLVFNAQSQCEHLFIPSSSGTGTVTPTATSNTWATYLGIDQFMQGAAATAISDSVPSSPNQTNGPIGDVFVIKRIQGVISGLWGDGFLALCNRLVALTNYPVMICNGAKSGHQPQDFYTDLRVVTQAGPISGFVPNGVTTVFNFTLASPTSAGWPLAGIGGYGSTTTWKSGGIPIIKAGTLVITVGAAIVIDDGVGNLTGVNVSSGTVNYKTGVCALTYSSPPATTTPSAAWTFIGDFQSGTAIAKTTLNGYSTTGVLGQQHTGLLSDLYLKLGLNKVTAVVFPWWTTLLTSYSGSADYTTDLNILTAVWDAIKYMHKQLPNTSDSIFFMGPAARECPVSGTTEAADRAKYGAHRVQTRAYVGSNADCRLLAETYNLTITGNSGPHEDFPGYQEMGEKYAVSIASGLGFNTTAEGPFVSSTAINGGRTVITLTYTFPDASATTLKANDGATTSGIKGFEVGHDASVQTTAFTNRVIDTDGTDGFTAAIASATTVTLTKTTGAWGAKVSLSYVAGNPVFTGTTNGAADAISLGKLLCDDSNGGKYTLGSAPAGNPARTILDAVI